MAVTKNLIVLQALSKPTGSEQAPKYVCKDKVIGT